MGNVPGEQRQGLQARVLPKRLSSGQQRWGVGFAAMRTMPVWRRVRGGDLCECDVHALRGRQIQGLGGCPGLPLVPPRDIQPGQQIYGICSMQTMPYRRRYGWRRRADELLRVQVRPDLLPGRHWECKFRDIVRTVPRGSSMRLRGVCIAFLIPKLL